MNHAVASEAWADLLGADENDFVSLLHKLGMVHQLPALARNQIEQIQGFTPDIHLKWLPAVETAFRRLRLQRPWSEFINHIDDASLLSLQVCDHELSMHSKPKIDNKRVSTLKTEANKIKSSVLDSDLAPEVANYLLRNLELIDRSLENYNLTGPDSLRDSIQITIGSIAVNLNIYNKSSEHEAGRAFWAFVTKIALILGLISASITIGGFVDTHWIDASANTHHEHHDGIEPQSRAVLRSEEED